ncbi:diaminopimelate epimerase [Hymenobacter sp. B81]|uniref:diaminopimelate epimerase n=1 Tax=Hymenobacter sp. B81 TaxID=3344878 RepID=UPI0037DC510F
MTIHFFKYQGTANDFVMVDDRARTFPAADHALVNRLCDRRRGIGADGLILLREAPGYDFEMVYFNADGHLGSMCGNGGRCTVAFAQQLGVIGEQARFLAADGPHEASIDEAGQVRLRMMDVEGQQEWPEGVFLNTGSPHVVSFLPPGTLAGYDVYGRGRAVRYGDAFRERGGTNVNFVEAPAAVGQPWQVRTYERGVENETHSCGTGVTAVALAAARRGAQSPVPLRTPGGELSVSFVAHADGSFTEVYLSGPAEYVFAGHLNL